MTLLWIRKKIHWSDTDAAGIAWFPNFFGWFEDAEEELYTAVLGQSRQSLLDAHRFGMPRVTAHAEYRAPVRAGQLIRIGLGATLEHPRRLRYDFEMRDAAAGTLLAEGFVRVACVTLDTFGPRDFPDAIAALVTRLPAAAARQADAGDELPWT